MDGGPVPDGGTPGDGGPSNPVVEENRREGAPDWRSGGSVPADNLGVYVSTESARAGETVEVLASSSSTRSAVAQVFRIGDYGGAGARLVWTSDSFGLAPGAACPMQQDTGLVECDWPAVTRFTVGADWLSGAYVVKVRRADGARAFTPFVVRDGRRAELLLQTTFTTDQAYNPYGGESLYQDDSGALPRGLGSKVSFDRPYLYNDGLGQFAARPLEFIQFVERSGYDVTYASNLDFIREARVLDGVGAMVVAGHDEYWPSVERDEVDAAVARGTSLVYFGANGGYWRIRLEPDARGRPLRTVVCFKGVQGDPQPGSTVRFRDPPNAHPENALFGVMYESYLIMRFPLFVANPDSWIFAGTGVGAGDRFLDLVGTEFDRVFENGETPAGLELAGESPVVSAESRPGVAQLVTRDLSGGGTVFSAGTIDWTLGLSSDPQWHDPRVERITRNVLERALRPWRAPVQLPPVSGNGPPEPAPDGAWASSVEPLAGMVRAAGGRDGPGASATFDGPMGLAVTPDGKVVVAEARGHRIRVIDTDVDHIVRTLAGTGWAGASDGPGDSARFDSPLGLAVDAAGAVYVADSNNHRIRRIDPGPGHRVTTVAGSVYGYADGPAMSARFLRPVALAFAPDGSLLVADSLNASIRRIDLAAGQVTTLAGSKHGGWEDASDGHLARFLYPTALSVTPGGDVLVVDAGNAAIRRIGAGPTHPVTTLVGVARVFGFADGPGGTARLRAQMGATMTPDGMLVVGDTANSRLRLVELGAGPATTRVRTLAGTGRAGSALGTGASSDLPTPGGLATLPDGSLVVSDPYNETVRRVVR